MLHRVLVIALNTYREAVRARILHGLFGLALATGGYSLIVGAYAVSDQLRVVERYSRPSMNYLMVEVTVEDPKVLTKPWKSAPRRWTLGNGDIYEFYCTNNRELEELEKVREQELQNK